MAKNKRIQPEAPDGVGGAGDPQSSTRRSDPLYGYWPSDELETAPYDSWDRPILHDYRERVGL